MTNLNCWKNSSLRSVRDKVKIKYISGRQPSSYELVFGVELGQTHILRWYQILSYIH